ncbi:MAG: hypothetical protein ACE5JB_03625 [bacterium]
MIFRVIIFDLDGTLVQSESLKAIHESGLIEKDWIVDDPAKLESVAHQKIYEKRSNFKIYEK